jgi:hypothetical protein
MCLITLTFLARILILLLFVWQAQSRPVACDSEMVASVTNETLQLPWCGAAGDAVDGGSRFGRSQIQVLIKVAGVDELAAALLSRKSKSDSGHGSRTGSVGLTGVPDPSPWIISIDGAAAVMASCVSRAWLGVDICRGLVVARVCGRKEVLEGLDGAGGPVRSVCARLQCNRAEAAQREADADQRRAVRGERRTDGGHWAGAGWLLGAGNFLWVSEV